MQAQDFKELQTKRLNLQPLVATFDFATYLFKLISNNREFFRFMPWAGIKTQEQEFDFLHGAEKNWKSKKSAIYGMYLKPEKKFIGVCSFFNIDWDDETGEIGYWLDPKYSRQGYMSEAANEIAKNFFDTGFKRIIIKADPDNIASCKTAEKCGFEREGVMRSVVFNPSLSRREDLVLYAKISNQKNNQK